MLSRPFTAAKQAGEAVHDMSFCPPVILIPPWYKPKKYNVNISYNMVSAFRDLSCDVERSAVRSQHDAAGDQGPSRTHTPGINITTTLGTTATTTTGVVRFQHEATG